MVERRAHYLSPSMRVEEEILAARRVLDTPSLDVVGDPQAFKEREKALDQFNNAVDLAQRSRCNLGRIMQSVERRLTPQEPV